MQYGFIRLFFQLATSLIIPFTYSVHKDLLVSMSVQYYSYT